MKPIVSSFVRPASIPETFRGWKFVDEWDSILCRSMAFRPLDLSVEPMGHFYTIVVESISSTDLMLMGRVVLSNDSVHIVKKKSYGTEPWLSIEEALEEMLKVFEQTKEIFEEAEMKVSMTAQEWEG